MVAGDLCRRICLKVYVDDLSGGSDAVCRNWFIDTRYATLSVAQRQFVGDMPITATPLMDRW
jgi:hypothetical protein